MREKELITVFNVKTGNVICEVIGNFDIRTRGNAIKIGNDRVIELRRVEDRPHKEEETGNDTEAFYVFRGKIDYCRIKLSNSKHMNIFPPVYSIEEESLDLPSSAKEMKSIIKKGNKAKEYLNKRKGVKL